MTNLQFLVHQPFVDYNYLLFVQHHWVEHVLYTLATVLPVHSNHDDRRYLSCLLTFCRHTGHLQALVGHWLMSQ